MGVGEHASDLDDAPIEDLFTEAKPNSQQPDARASCLQIAEFYDLSKSSFDLRPVACPNVLVNPIGTPE
jgi:hypothetical protein